jgi:metal-dependent HD superfamily phosphatase/phosphodiesterase
MPSTSFYEVHYSVVSEPGVGVIRFLPKDKAVEILGNMRNDQAVKRVTMLREDHAETLVEVLTTTAANFWEVLDLWNAESPHFLSDGAHRFEDGCVYCGRPDDYEPPTR